MKNVMESKMNLYFLTWNDGMVKRIEAPSETAAVNIANKGMPSSIDKLEYPSNYELFKVLHRLADKVETIENIIIKMVEHG